MARCIKKCKGVGKIAVVEFAEIGGGVRTRESALTTAAKRIREVGDGELGLASAYMEFRRTRRRMVIEETSSVSLVDGEASCGPVASVEEPNRVFEASPLCSSNTFSDLVEDRLIMSEPEGQRKSAQLETLTFSGGREIRSRTSLSSVSRAEKSDDMESTAGRHWTGANSSHGSTVHQMPSEFEIEEFFAAAEKDLQKRFSEKYNFDIVQGVPLEGRYEWVPVKP